MRPVKSRTRNVDEVDIEIQYLFQETGAWSLAARNHAASLERIACWTPLGSRACGRNLRFTSIIQASPQTSTIRHALFNITTIRSKTSN